MKVILIAGLLFLVTNAGLTQNIDSMDYLEYPYPTSILELSSGGRIAYFDSGVESEVTLLMIHGLGSYMRAWDAVKDSFPNYRVILVDLPGYGKSVPGLENYGMSVFAEKIREFMDSLRVGPVMLAGHSMGGQVAATFARRYPDRIEGLILVAPAGVERFSEQDEAWFQRIVTPEVVRSTPVKQVELNFALNFRGGVLPESARFMFEDRLRLMEIDLLFDAYCRMIPRCVFSMLDEALWEDQGWADVPVLVLWGDSDLLIPNKVLHPSLNTRDLKEMSLDLWPSAEVEIVAGAGHFIQWDRPDIFAKSARRFLAQ